MCECAAVRFSRELPFTSLICTIAATVSVDVFARLDNRKCLEPCLCEYPISDYGTRPFSQG